MRFPWTSASKTISVNMNSELPEFPCCELEIAINFHAADIGLLEKLVSFSSEIETQKMVRIHVTNISLQGKSTKVLEKILSLLKLHIKMQVYVDLQYFFFFKIKILVVCRQLKVSLYNVGLVHIAHSVANAVDRFCKSLDAHEDSSKNQVCIWRNQL